MTCFYTLDELRDFRGKLTELQLAGLREDQVDMRSVGLLTEAMLQTYIANHTQAVNLRGKLDADLAALAERCAYEKQKRIEFNQLRAKQELEWATRDKNGEPIKPGKWSE